jgi:hypothetical protein
MAPLTRVDPHPCWQDPVTITEWAEGKRRRTRTKPGDRQIEIVDGSPQKTPRDLGERDAQNPRGIGWCGVRDSARATSKKCANVLSPATRADLVALDDALNALAEIDPREAKVVESRFFGGLSVEETAFHDERGLETRSPRYCGDLYHSQY